MIWNINNDLWEISNGYIAFSSTFWKHGRTAYCFLIFEWQIEIEFTEQEMSQLMRLWYLSHRRPAKAQGSLRIRAASPEPLLFANMKYGNRGRIRPKIRNLAPLADCTYAFEDCIYRGWKVPQSHEMAQMEGEEKVFICLASVAVKSNAFSKRKFPETFQKELDIILNSLRVSMMGPRWTWRSYANAIGLRAGDVGVGE